MEFFEPRINADAAGFWEGCREHTLRFQRCRCCGHVRWPAAYLCPECLSSDTEMIQLPPEGVLYSYVVMHKPFHPSVADHQTTGGYPKLATVATVDLPLLAQSMPGDRLQFRLISVQEAQQLLRQQHEAMVEAINQMKEQAVLAVPGAGAKQFRLTINGEAFDVAIRQM